MPINLREGKLLTVFLSVALSLECANCNETRDFPS